MGIDIMSVPTCASAAATIVRSSNSNSVSVFMAGFAVGLLITVGAFVAHAKGARRRKRVGESFEATMGSNGFSMPVGDDPQAISVDVLGLGMGFEDQASYLRQVEHLAPGIGGIESHAVPFADTTGTSRSVREVLSRRLGVSPVISS